MSHLAYDEFKEAGGSLPGIAHLLSIDEDTAYRILTGTREHYDLEWAVTQTVGERTAKRVLALLQDTGVDEREVWLEPKRCTGCSRLDFFPVHHESKSGRSLYLECTGCGRVLQYWRQAKRRTLRRPDVSTEEIAAAYVAGAEQVTLAARHGVALSSIKHRLKIAGVAIRPHDRIPPQDPSIRERGRLKIIEMRRAKRASLTPKIVALEARGLSRSAISRKVGVSRPTVDRILSEVAA